MAPLPHADAGPCPWPAPPEEIALRIGQIHIWCAAPRDFSRSLSSFRSLLSVAELDRSAKFHFPTDCDSYIIRHALLRLILGRYLQQAPSGIEFSHGPYGKPMVKACGVPLHFNDSHSAELVLFAITAVGPVGVDVECMRPIAEFESIASQYFTPREVEVMRALPAGKKLEAFYSCWTGKEAYLKATGEGIGESLHKVEVILDAGLRATSLSFHGDEVCSAPAWQLRAFSPAPGYLGAVSVQTDLSELDLWRIPACWADPAALRKYISSRTSSTCFPSIDIR
jgi:4'-phosphopantetheinyl transferase